VEVGRGQDLITGVIGSFVPFTTSNSTTSFASCGPYLYSAIITTPFVTSYYIVASSRPVSEEKTGAAMEHITMIAATISSDKEVQGKLARLCIGQEEMPIDGRSISQCLEEMHRQGWNVTTARAKPGPTGCICEYEFQRP
jgi:hypothetical protein